MKIKESILVKYAQYIVGTSISSPKFGVGKCISISDKSMMIDFGEDQGVKKLAFPFSIVNNLVSLLDEDEIYKRIEEKRSLDYTGSLLEIIQERGIKEFVHYTRVRNLKSIMEYGICSVEYMEKHGINYIENDKQRLDGRKNAISISVSFPNYKNFYILKEREREEWCMILLDPLKVIRLDCAFFWTNAANKQCRGLKWEDLHKADAFERMFSSTSRNTYIPDYYTTDPQAEIMIKDRIPAEYIECVVFDYFTDFDPKQLSCKCICDGEYFRARLDYKDWSSGVG